MSVNMCVSPAGTKITLPGPTGTVPEAVAIVESANGGNQTVPTLVYADGTAQTNPSLIQVKAKVAELTVS